MQKYFANIVRSFYHQHDGKTAYYVADGFIKGLSYAIIRRDIDELIQLNEELFEKAITAEFDYNNM